MKPQDYDVLIDLALDTRDFEWAKELQEKKEKAKGDVDGTTLKATATEEIVDTDEAQLIEEFYARLRSLEVKGHDSLVELLEDVDEILADMDDKFTSLVVGLFEELKELPIDLKGVEVKTFNLEVLIDSFLKEGRKGQTLAEFIDDQLFG